MYTSNLSRSVEIGLRLMGVWPTSSFSFLYQITWVITATAVQYFQYWYIIENIGSTDLLLLVDCLSITFAYSLMCIKLVLVWLNRRTLFDILTSMTTNWEECIADFHVRMMSEKAALSQRFSNIMIGVNAASVVLYESGSYYFQDADEDGNPLHQLPLKMKFPFDTERSPIFEITLTAVFIHHMASATIVAVLNSFIVSAIFHIGGQIDITCRDLTETSPKDKFKCKSRIRIFVIRHQKIIAFSNNIENLFTYIALVQMLWNTLVICCIGFMIIISIGSKGGFLMLIKLIGFYVAITLEAFVFCFAGEYLSSKVCFFYEFTSKLINEAVYESSWYNMSPVETRKLLLLMIRSQKRLTITAGKVMQLSLESFTSIIKASMSYISVLRAMY